MIINENTKIGSIIKHHPDALETIISISPDFEKLRNPFLRKIMAGRASIKMASKIAGCSVSDFFDKLIPLGFEIDNEVKPLITLKKKLPEFITSIKKDQIIELDVRPILASKIDPLNTILEKIKKVEQGHVLKIINTFEPIPLIKLLEKKGFETYSDSVDDNLVETYFYKKLDSTFENKFPIIQASKDWFEVLGQFKDKTETIDVRSFEMPQPMIRILEALDNLPSGLALFVYHKRIPVYLLPEIAERNFEIRINEISDCEVHLLIFKI